MSPSLDALRREMAVILDVQGVVRWADARAEQLLGARVGSDLATFAARGSEDKLAILLRTAASRPVQRWEVALTVEGAPATLACNAMPHDEGIAMVMSLVPEDYGMALTHVGDTLGELSDLHRRVAQQKAELEQQNEELRRLNREVADSSRGVVALHAELDERAESIVKVSEARIRVMRNVSHEFRTPVNSILGLTQLLLSRSDGPLTDEQHKQITYVRQAAQALSTIANDLLDLSQVNAGSTMLRARRLSLAELVATLRGMLRPLATSSDVELIFDEPEDGPMIETDEGKLSQIVRNLVSNALKFTQRGTVRVSTVIEEESLIVRVSDTGIGVSPIDLERIFEEFYQVESSLQARSKGTGLGLPLSRKLAEILGGELSATSRPGEGTTFELKIPRVHRDVADLGVLQDKSKRLDPSRAPVLVVEDDRQTLFLYERYLHNSGFQVVPVRSIDDARAELQRFRPAAIVLDVMLEGETSWKFLDEIKSNPETRDIPTLIVTVTDREQKARALGADEFFIKPVQKDWLLSKLQRAARTGQGDRVLMIDDDDVARYLVRKMLEDTPYRLIEASNGADGLRLARTDRPQVIILDFVMPEMTAFEVLDELKKDPLTRSIPVIVSTGKQLGEDERARLRLETAAILSKQSLSREIAIGRIREALVNAGVRPDRRDDE